MTISWKTTQTPQKPILCKGKPGFKVTGHYFTTCVSHSFKYCIYLFSYLCTCLSFPFIISLFWCQLLNCSRPLFILLVRYKTSIRLNSFQPILFWENSETAFSITLMIIRVEYRWSVELLFACFSTICARKRDVHKTERGGVKSNTCFLHFFFEKYFGWVLKGRFCFLLLFVCLFFPVHQFNQENKLFTLP